MERGDSSSPLQPAAAGDEERRDELPPPSPPHVVSHLPPQTGLNKPLETSSPPSSSSSLLPSTDSCSHLISFGFREVQEAIKELDIASQVRKKESSRLYCDYLFVCIL